MNTKMPRVFRCFVASVSIALGLASTTTALGQGTANGEIQGRPAPVFRCPGLPCGVPNVFNITVAVQYNASAADLTAIQNMISAASAILFDVTDGQAEIGQAFIYNNASSASSADLRIYPSTSDTWWKADTGQWKVGGSMHVSINRVLAAAVPGEFLAHEFVHLVFDARDEYESRLAGCGALNGGASCPDAAAIAAGQTQCLMDGGGNGVSSELCWGAGNPANLTDVSGGNHDATTITEHSRCRSNRSCWAQLLWSWPDQFTAPAGVPDPNANGAVVDPTQFIIANSTVRVVLVLDESGSMSSESPSRMERLKVAANDFVTLSENGTELGIVSFSTDAEAASGHASVAINALNAAHRTTCSTAINNLTPNGWTAIGQGLRKARDMIFTAGGVTANTYIVLMTDGINNRPLPDAAADLNGILADLMADGIPVLVTCTGGDLGLSSQCSEIATATGGFSVDSAHPADLQQAFVDFHERISGRQSVDAAIGRLTNGVVQRVYVEDGVDSATFTLTWPDEKTPMTMSVIDPSGTAHQSAVMPQGRYTRLVAPKAGEYLMVVSNREPVSAAYVARAYTRNRIQSLTAASRYPTVRPGDAIYIYGYPRSLGGSITERGNGIPATVLLPTGQTDTMTLVDNGTAGDAAADDGIFTGIYLKTRDKGPYRFTLRADMTDWMSSLDGEEVGIPRKSPRFTREVRLTTSVGEPSDKARARISINEWMASNTHTLTNPATGRPDDWFELYNPNAFSVDLSGWLLASSINSATPYVIPQGYVMPAKAFRIVWADGRNSTNQGTLHANFTLGGNVDTIALLAPDGMVIDYVTFGRQTNDISQGRSPDAGPYRFYFTSPTPGKPNSLMQPPQLRAIATFDDRGTVIRFNTVAGLIYRVEYNNRLSAPNWTQLAPAQVATGTSMSVPDLTGARSQRFYRIVVE